MLDIINKVHVHMPFHLLPQYQGFILQQKLNPEIYFSHYALQNIDRAICVETAELFSSAGLKITFHAPFMDLSPGAADDKIRQITPFHHRSQTAHYVIAYICRTTDSFRRRGV